MKLEAVSLQDMKVNLDSTRKKKVGVEWNRALGDKIAHVGFCSGVLVI